MHIKASLSIRAAWIVILLALSNSSCGLFSGSSRDSPEQLAREERLTRVQGDVMRLADQAILDLGGSARRFARAVGTSDARRLALTWSVSHTNRVLSIASNPKPLTALVDLLLFASVQRIFHEEYWLPEVHGEADRPMLEAFERLEAACWKSVGTVLDKRQQAALRDALTAWRKENPDLATAAAVEAPSFAEVSSPIKDGDRVPVLSDLIDLVSLDPLSGLEPAVREVTTTRQLGERMFFYSQHLPRLLEQEAELLTQRTVNLPEVRTTIEGAERISCAAESLAATATQLPETLRSALEQSRATLEQGTRTAESISNGIAALDRFVARTAATDPDSAPARPFDVREYGEAAERIGAAAVQLTTAITATDQNAPVAQRVLDQAAQRIDRSVDHAYARARSLLLWSVALVSAAVVGLRLVWSFLPRRAADVVAERRRRRSAHSHSTHSIEDSP